MLMRTDPFRDFDRLTQRLLGDGTTRAAAMPLDAYRENDTFVVSFDLPGVRMDTIDLEVERDVLTVKAERPAPTTDQERAMVVGERPYGSFTRQLFLGESLDTERIEAEYTDGVLTLRIPVAEQAKPRKISVTSSGGQSREISA